MVGTRGCLKGTSEMMDLHLGSPASERGAASDMPAISRFGNSYSSRDRSSVVVAIFPSPTISTGRTKC